MVMGSGFFYCSCKNSDFEGKMINKNSDFEGKALYKNSDFVLVKKPDEIMR